MKRNLPKLALAIRPHEWCVIAGAPDHEMKRCVRRAREAGLTVVYARHATQPNQRCTVEDAALGTWRLPPKLPAHCHYLLLELTLSPGHHAQLQKHRALSWLVLDHHTPEAPPFSTLHQLNTFLLGGTDELMLAHYDHDAEHAYAFWGDRLLEARLRWTKSDASDYERASHYVASLAPIAPNLLYGATPPPNILVWDALILRRCAGLLRAPANGSRQTVKYTLGGATRQAADSIEAIYERVRTLGWRVYRTRAIGGFYVPAGTKFHPSLILP